MWKETWKTNILAIWKLIELYQKEWEIDGKIKLFENARRPPWVRIIFEKEEKILLTKEFRWEHKSFDYRLPWGKVFDTLSDMKSFDWEMLDAAKNAAIIEGNEECGILIEKDDLQLFKISHAWATIEWDLYYFIVKEFQETGKQNLWDGEYITFNWYSKEEIVDFVRNWEISEDRTKGILWEYFLIHRI